MARTYRFISADGHFESPPEMWTHRVAAGYRDRAPRHIKLADGGDAVVNEGQSLTYGGTSWYGGGPPERFDPTRIAYDNTPGTGGPEQRLREMDEDGIDAEVLFALGVRNPRIRDSKAFLAVIKGFNDYFAEEYCAADPERLIGVAVLPNAGADEDIAEMERCTRMGLKAVWLSTYPSGKGYPSDEDDRFWAAAVDMGVPLIVHTSFPSRVGVRDVALLKYPREPEGEDKPPTDLVQRLARQGPYHSGALEAAQMVISGLFERFPKLRVYWAENNVGWLPYYYEQIDHEYEVNRFWAERHLGLQRLKQRPSEYLREHAYWGFFEDRAGIRQRYEIGVDRMLWSTDFPHLVTRWPHSREFFEKQTEGVPEDEKHLLAAGNAVRFFGLGQA